MPDNQIDAPVTIIENEISAPIMLGGTPLSVDDDGAQVVKHASRLDFRGAQVSVSEPTPGVARVDITGDGTGDMQASTYDPAAIEEQLVGTDAAQTLANKTLTDPVITKIIDGAGGNFAQFTGIGPGTPADTFLRLETSDDTLRKLTLAGWGSGDTDLCLKGKNDGKVIIEDQLEVQGDLTVNGKALRYTNRLDALANRPDLSIIGLCGQSNIYNSNMPPIHTEPLHAELVCWQDGVKSDTFTRLKRLVEDNQPGQNGSQGSETGALMAGDQLLQSIAAAGGALGFQYYFQNHAVSGAKLEELLRDADPVDPEIQNYWDLYVDPPMQAIAALAAAEGKSAEIPCVIIRHGEDNNTDGIAEWKDDLAQYMADWNGLALELFGQTEAVKFISYQTSGAITTNVGVPTALGQWETADENPDYVISTPGYPIYAQGLFSDTIHFSAEGKALIGVYDGIAMGDMLYSHKPRGTRPLSARVENQVVTVQFQVDNYLEINTDVVPAVQDFGVRVTDDSGDLTLSNIRVVSESELAIDIDRATASNCVIRFGLDYTYAGSTINGEASTNLCSHSDEFARIDGTVYTLHRWCEHAEIPVPEGGGLQPITDLWRPAVDAGTGYPPDLGSSTLVELGAAPTFHPDSVTVSPATSLDTLYNAPSGDFTAWAVVRADDPGNYDGVIFDNHDGALGNAGFLLYIASGATDQLSLIHGGAFTNHIIEEGYVGWLFVGVTRDSSGVTVWCSEPGGADGAKFGGFDFSSPNPVSLGRSTYVGGGAAGSMQVALAGFAGRHYDAMEREQLEEDAMMRLFDRGLVPFDDPGYLDDDREHFIGQFSPGLRTAPPTPGKRFSVHTIGTVGITIYPADGKRFILDGDDTMLPDQGISNGAEQGKIAWFTYYDPDTWLVESNEWFNAGTLDAPLPPP